jgi:hypothetical protein
VLSSLGSPLRKGEQVRFGKMILLKNPRNASTRLSMNGSSPKIFTVLPFVLRPSKDERWIFQQNRKIRCEKDLDMSNFTI